MTGMSIITFFPPSSAHLPEPNNDEGGVEEPAVELNLSAEFQISLEQDFNAVLDDSNYRIRVGSH